MQKDRLLVCNFCPHLQRDSLRWTPGVFMLKLNSHPAGRHFLQIPGPSTVPDRILRAMDYPTIDHRGPEFQAMGKKVLADIKKVFQTKSSVVIYPSSGTGAWEAALVNTLSPGDHVLMYETGHFATLWKKMAERLSLKSEFIGGDWRRGVDPVKIEARLAEDKTHSIKAVCVVHNETSTGVTSNVAAVRRAIDNAKHPALLLVDTISSLGSIDYRHDEWGVDVTVSGSQKGLMLPPGLSCNAVSDKAVAASRQATLPRAYWSWDEIIEANKNGFWCTRRRPICCTGCPKPATCCSKKACRTFFPAMSATPRRRARRCAPGVWKSCARTRPNTAAC